ncbi:MAG: response regulator [Vallitaleaceae bacterium]|nr:response regulator [Vallitaleaceae bacterium]
MIRVFMADDEEEVLKGMKKIVDWEDLGYEICGTAADGQSAYEDVLGLQPELLILDIHMPKMQGIEVASELRKQNYQGRIIILSGYSEFRYAQEAMKLGVDYYLTKPIDEDDLEKALIEIRTLIQKEMLHASHLSYYQNQAKYKILKDFMEAPLDQDSVSLATYRFSLTDLQLSADEYQIVIVNSGEGYQSLLNLLKIPDGFSAIEKLLFHEMEVLLLKGGQIIRKLQEAMSLDANSEHKEIMVGRVVNSMNEIYFSYHDALALKERAFFLKCEGGILTPDLLPKTEELSLLLKPEDAKKYGKAWYDLIQIGQRKKAEEYIEQLTESFRSAKNSVDSIKSFLAGMYLYVKHEIAKDYPNHRVEIPEHAKIIAQIHDCQYLEEVKAYFMEQQVRIMEGFGDSDCESRIDEMIYYMEHNYSKDLKLKNIAEAFGYNSSYLGKAFTKKMKMSFNDYLHEIRVEQAKQLLEKGQLKVYEVSESVGYRNLDYFYTKFRKYVGMSPSEYSTLVKK